MSKVFYSLRRANLRELNNYAPVKPNDARRSSTYSMISRYVLICDRLPKLGIVDIDDQMLGRKED